MIRTVWPSGEPGLEFESISDPRRFIEGDQMLTVNGQGTLISDGDDGWLRPASASQIEMTGSFQLKIDCADDQVFEFRAVQFSGEAEIEIQGGGTVIFTNCGFDENTMIKIIGGPAALNFSACFFAQGATVDCSGFQFSSPLDVVDCDEEEDAGFIMPEIVSSDT